MKDSGSLVLLGKRPVVSMNGYSGVCHDCNSPVRYDGEMTVIEIERDEHRAVVVPVDRFQCPHCSVLIKGISVYFSLDVSSEIKAATGSE